MRVDDDVRGVLAMVFGRPPPGNALDGSQVARLIAENRVPLAALDRQAAPSVWRVPEVAALADRELTRYRRARQSYLRVAEAWERAGIRAVLIKSPGYFPYTSDNVDALVDPEHEPAAGLELVKLGFVELPHLREPFKRLFRRAHGDDLGFAVHVHTRVAWINTFLPGQEVLRHARPSPTDPDIHIPSSEHGFMITTAHWVYEDKEVKVRDLYHASLALHEPLDWPYIRETSERFGWETGLRLGLLLYRRVGRALGLPGPLVDLEPDGSVPRWLERYSDWVLRRPGGLPVRLSKMVNKALHFEKTLEDTTLDPEEKVAEWGLLARFAVHAKTVTRRRHRPFVISVSGPDGSGKTTMAQELETLFELCQVPAHHHWIRLGSSPALELVKRLAPIPALRAHGDGGPRETASGADGAGTPPRPGSEADTAYKAFLRDHARLKSGWVRVLETDYLARLWLSVLWARLRGGVHIFDRFLVDAAADVQAMYRMPADRWFTELAPVADVAVMLEVDPEEARRRSRSPVPYEWLADSSRLYRANGHRFDLTVPATTSRDEARDRVVRPVMERYFGGVE